MAAHQSIRQRTPLMRALGLYREYLSRPRMENRDLLFAHLKIAALPRRYRVDQP